MNKENSVLGLIGFAMKSGQICLGTEAVQEGVQKRKVKIVIMAENASEKAKENMKFLCDKFNVPIAVLGNIETISKAIGKQNKSVIGIKEKNLSEEIYKIICGGEAIG